MREINVLRERHTEHLCCGECDASPVCTIFICKTPGDNEECAGADVRTRHHPLIRADVLRARHDLRPSARLLNHHPARDDQPDFIHDHSLDLGANDGPEYDTRVET